MMSCTQWMRIFFLVATSFGTICPALAQQLSPTAQPLAAQANEPATGTEAKPVAIPEVKVKEMREEGYRVKEASTATRTDTPIRDVPQSIQVITRKVIEEQRALRLNDVLQNVSGVMPFGVNTGVGDFFFIRGFPATNNNFFRDGLFDPVASQVGTDPYSVQRLEVLKGPAAVLYGLGDPGGIINIITRKPLPNAEYSANVTLGNFNLYRSELNATGPLNADKTLLYRMTVVGQKADSFIDFVNRDLVGVRPSVTWLMGSRTTLTVDGEYFKRWMSPAAGLPAQGTVLPNINGEIPRNRFSGFGDFDFNNRTLYRIGYDLTHQFNNTWSLRNMYRFMIQEIHQNTGGVLALLPNQRTVTRSWGGGGAETNLDRSHLHSMVTNLVGHFQLWNMDHTLLTGGGVTRTAVQSFTNIDPNGPLLEPGSLCTELRYQPV